MRMIDLHCNKLLPRSTFQCTALYFHKPPSFAYFLAILHTIHHKRSIILPSSFTVSRSHRGFTRLILSAIIWNFKTLLCLNFNSHLLHTKGFWICRQEQHHKDSLMLRTIFKWLWCWSCLCKQSSDHMTPKLTHRTLGCACQRLISTSASSRYFAQTWIPPHNEAQHWNTVPVEQCEIILQWFDQGQENSCPACPADNSILPRRRNRGF